MSKSCKSIPKTCCERYKRHLRAYAQNKSVNVCTTNNHLSNCEKNPCTGILNKTKESKMTTPKKTTRSDFNLNHLHNNIDYCKNCGDVASKSDVRNGSSSKTTNSRMGDTICKTANTINGSIKTSNNNPNNPIEQFYRNKNFKRSSHSFDTKAIKQNSLNPILEQSEKISDATDKSVFQIYTESDDELTLMDPDDSENLKSIKEFRHENYFECHSAKSRIKPNVANLKHKCIYRFYLNDRLFPVPMNTDYNDNIRCIECGLPLEKNEHDSKINGTVQAKVKINNKIQDMLLILPVNNSLIVKEKRKEVQHEKDEYIYFGIIKLDLNGNSVFNKTLPEDSLALRYQKGFTEHYRNEKYEFDCVGNSDVINI